MSRPYWMNILEVPDPPEDMYAMSRYQPRRNEPNHTRGGFDNDTAKRMKQRMELAPPKRFYLGDQSPDGNDPFIPRDKEDLNDTSTESKATGIRSPREVLSKRNVNGIWDPYHTADITVHLKMSLREDLDEILEEFCRLQRLGNFASARQLFAENLQEHIDKPYILIEYAEMLLEQGDYKTLSEIDDDTIYNMYMNSKHDSDQSLLRKYWEMIQLLVAHYRPGRPGVSLSEFDIVRDTLNHLQSIMSAEGEVSSTEIKMLAVAYRLVDLTKYWYSNLHWRLDVLFPPEFHRSLYSNLLRQGRIWDFRDIAVARMLTPNLDITKDWSDGLDFRRRLQSLAKDWSDVVGVYDTSTTLALLDVLVSLALEKLSDTTEIDSLIEPILSESAPLALSIIENDPGSMKSRPFTRWMLAKAEFANRKGPYHIMSQIRHLVVSPGMYFYPKRIPLPQYVPTMTENPGWSIAQASPEFVGPVRIAMKTSKALGDYQTEAAALQELIKLSSQPTEEFKEICTLQKLTQGDLYNYSHTLISTYLVSHTKDMRVDLKREIFGLLSMPFITDCLSLKDCWTLSVMKYALEDEQLLSKRALQEADENFKRLPEVLQDEIRKKMPGVKQRIGKTKHELVKPITSQSDLEEEQDRLDADQKILNVKKEYQNREKDDGRGSSSEGSKDFDVAIKPHMLDGKKMIIYFEDIENPTERQEISYQIDTTKKALVEGPEVFDRYHLKPQKDGKTMKATKIDLRMRKRGPESSEAAYESTVQTINSTSTENLRPELFTRAGFTENSREATSSQPQTVAQVSEKDISDPEQWFDAESSVNLSSEEASIATQGTRSQSSSRPSLRLQGKALHFDSDRSPFQKLRQARRILGLLESRLANGGADEFLQITIDKQKSEVQELEQQCELEPQHHPQNERLKYPVTCATPRSSERLKMEEMHIDTANGGSNTLSNVVEEISDYEQKTSQKERYQFSKRSPPPPSTSRPGVLPTIAGSVRNHDKLCPLKQEPEVEDNIKKGLGREPEVTQNDHQEQSSGKPQYSTDDKDKWVVNPDLQNALEHNISAPPPQRIPSQDDAPAGTRIEQRPYSVTKRQFSQNISHQSNPPGSVYVSPRRRESMFSPEENIRDLPPLEENIKQDRQDREIGSNTTDDDLLIDRLRSRFSKDRVTEQYPRDTLEEAVRKDESSKIPTVATENQDVVGIPTRKWKGKGKGKEVLNENKVIFDKRKHKEREAVREEEHKKHDTREMAEEDIKSLSRSE
ncbi:hypothetical protein F4819DRAFT_444503 [Hypoxylon fuscum]|nr:hypothetical protein F4819DRAFT_444503 [Hypoxylon fuscum]